VLILHEHMLVLRASAEVNQIKLRAGARALSGCNLFAGALLQCARDKIIYFQADYFARRRRRAPFFASSLTPSVRTPHARNENFIPLCCELVKKLSTRCSSGSAVSSPGARFHSQPPPLLLLLDGKTSIIWDW
jgi:hypothetical protein